MGIKYIVHGDTAYPGTSAYPILTRIDDDGEWSQLPINAVEVDDAIFQRSIAEPDAWLFDLASVGLVRKPAPTPAELLPRAQAAQIAALYQAFAAATYADIDYNGAAYQADETARARISRAITTYSTAGSVPAGFYWVASDNTRRPAQLADLQSMAKLIADREWGYFQHLQDLKDQVRAVQPADPDPVGAVQAIAW